MSILSRWAAFGDTARRAVIALLLLASGTVAFAAVEYSFSDPSLAAWWPAGGFAVAAGMLSRGRERWLVILLVIAVTGLGNLLAGRDLPFAVLLGVGNTVEVVIIAAALAPRGQPSSLATLRQVRRFIAVTLGAAIGSGLVLGVVASIFLDRPFAEALFQLSASHAAATLVMLPLLLVPIASRRSVRWLEVVAQSTMLVALVALVFWPGNTWPVAFLPLVPYLWGAFRFPILISASQLFVTTAAVIVLTTLGGGPFAAFVDEGRTPVVLIQLFLLVYAITALVVTAARYDWNALLVRVTAQEEVLREGIVNAEVGIIIAEHENGALRVIAENARARAVLGAGNPPFGIGELDAALAAGTSARVQFEKGGHSFDTTIAIRPTAHSGELLTIVLVDVTERQERERLALESAAQLRQLNAQKDDFIAAVSHELRTPVTSIIGFSEQLDGGSLPEDLALAGEIIARNARRLADVIEDVLELSRLSAVGASSPPPAAVDLVALARDCAADAEGLAPERGIRVQVRSNQERVIVHTRERDLIRVCANLLSNAVKFSHDGGRVLIDVEVDMAHDGARIRVIDRGIGIPEEYRELVWERFARAPIDAHRAVPGTGLGLPIVKALVETRLGGQVTLGDTEGGGTTVEVQLPAEPPAL